MDLPELEMPNREIADVGIRDAEVKIIEVDRFGSLVEAAGNVYCMEFDFGFDK